MRAKKQSTSTLQRATPLPRGSACLQCRTRRVKCDGGLPCKACVRHTKFHGHAECECVYTPPPPPRSAVKRSAAAAAEPDEVPTKSTGPAHGDDDAEKKPAVGSQDEVRLEVLESHMVDLERKITASLLTAQDPALPLSPLPHQGFSYPSPAPSLDDAPTPPLSYSPLDSNLSYTSFDAPLLFPSVQPFFAYPPQLYFPPMPVDPPRQQKEAYNDVSQWAAPYSSYDYPFVSPHDVGGEPGIVGWEQSCGAQNEWQPGLGVGLFDEPDRGTGWTDWSV